MSSQGMQDHFGANSANWLADWLTNCRTCQPRFQFHQAKPGRTLERGCDELDSKNVVNKRDQAINRHSRSTYGRKSWNGVQSSRSLFDMESKLFNAVL